MLIWQAQDEIGAGLLDNYQIVLVLVLVLMKIFIGVVYWPSPGRD
jgi:hypothetical protein